MSIYVKVRFKDERRFMFLGGRPGTAVRHRIHAAIWSDEAAAVRDAERMVEPGTDVVAAAVMRNGRRIHHVGEPTPPPPDPRFGPAAGYRYLVGVTATGRPVFEIKDTAGRWAVFDGEAWEACAEEKTKAGITHNGMNVHCSCASIFSHQVKLIQHSNRAEAAA